MSTIIGDLPAQDYNPAMYELLKTVNEPAALRQLDHRQLHQLAAELRAYLLDTVSKTGGHLSSNLGTVELTIALHYVFNTPEDRIVWDVGHQTYAHKILTGRREQMARLRMIDGISGFPRRSESKYDAFGTAHSSTSISAALGMAVAAKRKGESRRVVAVIGDGALSAGMAFEAMNNAGVMDSDLLVILNDNEMSISPAVGALNRYLARLMSGPYVAARKAGKMLLSAVPPLYEFARRVEEHAKGLIVPSTLFEELGFTYIGPIDGHDLDSLIPTLNNITEMKGPRFLHVVTKKGQGYKLAEDDPIAYHGPGKFDLTEGIKKSAAGGKPTYSQVFGDWLCDMARIDKRLMAITPAMREGSGMVRFSEEYPDRYFDVAIAEQHAVTFAAGMACEGLKPVVAIYSTFLQRGYDQLIHDVAIQNLPVLFALDRGGVVGGDGQTHNGSFDYAFLRTVPNLTLMAPADENECRQMLFTGYQLDSPAAVRYPRGSGPGVALQKEFASIPIGKGEVRREGKKIAILSFGSMLVPALQAAEKLGATVANMRFIKPLDTALVKRLADTHDLLVTLEEHQIMGGAGSAVCEALASLNIEKKVLLLGLPDRFIDHGDSAKLLSDVGLDAQGVEKSIRNAIPE